MRPGETLWVTVVQDGIDVALSIVGPEGEDLLTVDSPGGLWGEEWLLQREPASIGSVLEIRALDSVGAPGRYRLSVESRDPSDSGNLRRATEWALTEAARLVVVGTLQSRRQAVDNYQQALTGWQKLAREAEAARTSFLLGMLHRRLDEPLEALPWLRQALASWRGLGDRQGQAQARMELASTARRLGQNQNVEVSYQQALSLWRDLGDLHGQAWTLNYLGLIRAREAPRQAVDAYAQSLTLFRQIGDSLQEGVVLNNLGGIHDLLGEPGQALEHFREALDIHQRLANQKQEAAVWNNIASVHRRMGRLQEALSGYQTSLDVRRQLGDLRGQGRVLNNIGLTWLSLGEASRALNALRQALQLRREAEDRRGEAITLQNLGLVQAELDAWEVATDHWQQALALRRVLGDRAGEVTSLMSLGRAASRLDHSVAARQYLEDALAILDDLGNPWRQARALEVLGRILIAAGEAEDAVTNLKRSVSLFRAIGDEIGEGSSLLALAQAERAARPVAGSPDSHLQVAYAHAIQALDLLETVRADVANLGLRTSFFSRHGDAFEVAVDLAMELHRLNPEDDWAARAFEISERARARSFLDLLQDSSAGLWRGADPTFLARQQVLLDRLNAKVARRRRHLERQGPSEESRQLAREIAEVQAQLEGVEDQIRRQSPAWDARVQSRPLAARAIQQLLDPDVTLLVVSLGDTRSFLWGVTEDRLEAFELPRREVVERAAREVYEGFRIHDPRSQRVDAEAAARLSEMLLGPVAHRLNDQRLAIVADGALHYLPFAALPNPTEPSRPLLVDHEIVSLPSASILAVQRQTLAGRPTAPKALAVLADPVFDASDSRLKASVFPAEPTSGVASPMRDAGGSMAVDRPAEDFRLERLAWSRWEAEAIAAYVGEGQAHLALGFDAGLQAVREGRLSGYRVVHFATHGIVDGEHPELSALVLSRFEANGDPREGFLRLPEIYHLELAAELVVLSGCRTALGQEIRGEGLVGLTRGFFAAGARRLVASLWRVQDRSAAELMDRFYRRLLREEDGMCPSAALRAAQLELMHEPGYRDPYHWAAFAAYGDWR